MEIPGKLVVVLIIFRCTLPSELQSLFRCPPPKRLTYLDNGCTKAVISQYKFKFNSMPYTNKRPKTRDFFNGRVLPYQNIYTSNNTADACLSQCSAFGYSAAGLEYGNQCCSSFIPYLRSLIDSSILKIAETLQT